MCHIGTPGHGVRFQAKLKRLARLGEALAAKEVEEYKESYLLEQKSLTAQVKTALEDAAWGWDKAIPWCQARGRIAARIPIEPERLKTVAPWAQKVWRKLLLERWGDAPVECSRSRCSPEGL
jgi:hypothetical protein